MKKQIVIAVTALALSAGYCSAKDGMSKTEIDALPQDKVKIIKDACKVKWGDDFDMRIFCEDKQYRALQFLIERNR